MSNMLKKRKRLADVEVRYYLQQLVKALQYLHSNLVIHRDLKLGNLFIDSQMRLKVGDFGLATRLTDPLERKKTFCGTPNYIGDYFCCRVISTFIFIFMPALLFMFSKHSLYSSNEQFYLLLYAILTSYYSDHFHNYLTSQYSLFCHSPGGVGGQERTQL